MYIPDLAPFQLSETHPAMVAVGWLDSVHAYPTGPAPDGFLDQLKLFCLTPNIGSMGIHECEFCPALSSTITISEGATKHRLGSCIIEVFGADNTIYAAPDLIYHYVRDHQYRPPELFIESVLHGPAPLSRKYRARRLQVLAVTLRNNATLRELHRAHEEETVLGRVKWWLIDRIWQ